MCMTLRSLRKKGKTMGMPKKFFISTPIYYVNAKPHIGHIYATTAADVMARWHRKQGDKVLFSTGTDENSQKNVEAAEKQGKDVKKYVDEMASVWENIFKELKFSNDVFVRTTSPEHAKAVTALLSAIEAKGDIYMGEYKGLYCVGCEEFIAEKDLVDGKCAIHQTAPKEIKENNYFFRLSNYRDQLLKYFEDNLEFVKPDSARNKVLDYIKNDLADISISRQAQEWGIRLQSDPTHAVYVWFDALINYLTVTGYPDEENSREFWPADIHLVGKDIIKFHCAIWPAMLLSAGLPLPHQVFAHGFFTVDGQKISKSLGNAIDPLELIKEYPFDAIRYYLLRDIPFGSDGDFSHERLHGRYQADLANGLGNLVSRTLNMIAQFHPEFAPEDMKDTSNLPTEVTQPIALVEQHIPHLEFDKALANIQLVIAYCDELIERTKPWQQVKEGNTQEAQKTLEILFGALVQLNEAIEPFMPETHDTLSDILEKRPIQKPEKPLFARIEKVD